MTESLDGVVPKLVRVAGDGLRGAAPFAARYCARHARSDGRKMLLIAGRSACEVMRIGDLWKVLLR